MHEISVLNISRKLNFVEQASEQTGRIKTNQVPSHGSVTAAFLT
jgi:hypothetical protein